MRPFLLPIAALTTLTLAGCGGDAAKPLNSEAFYRPRNSIDRGNGVGARPSVGPVDEAGSITPTARKSNDNDGGVTGISDVVADSVKPTYVPPGRPLVLAPLPPTTGPATTEPASAALRLAPATLPTGQYMIVGVVLGSVDGTPIYANQVFSAINKELSVRAKEMDEVRFRDFASQSILEEVRLLSRNEVVYRAADRSLDESDRKLADMLTKKWRQDQINDAGGSEELARRKCKADGIDFDQWVENQHRFYVTQVYYEKKIYPLIIVTADMLREYYDRNLATMFTDKSAAQFRIIKIDPAQVGSRDRALARAKEWQAKLADGSEDFEAVARKQTDRYLAAHAGLPVDGMIDRGAYVNKKVEDAAWALQIGQVSDVLTIDDVYYIVKLEKKTVGRVRSFDSEEVQDQISRTLRNEQFRMLKDREDKKLTAEAIYTQDDNSMNLALEMAMQRYAQWHGD